jgi:hypothetical protein
MNTKNLEKSPIKDKYFARTEKWDWLTKEMIHVFDSKSPRVITMDPWPQIIYLDAVGEKTVRDYIYNFAKKYPQNQIPEELADTILEMFSKLVDEEKIIELSDNPIILDDSLKNPISEEGEIDIVGTWKGTYTYNLPDEYKTGKMQKVEFTIKIEKVKARNFWGSVEDNLKTGGTPGIGEITGKYTNEEVQFDKNMPIYTEIDKNGNHVSDDTKKHPTILYKGVFSRNKRHITGIWLFKKKKLFWKGIFPVWYSLGNGTFTMKKENN